MKEGENMKKYTVVTTSGFTISLIADDFDRDPQRGRIAFYIKNTVVAMFELSNIAGFCTVEEVDKT